MSKHTDRTMEEAMRALANLQMSGLPPSEVMTAITVMAGIQIASLTVKPGSTIDDVISVFTKGIKDVVAETGPMFEQLKKQLDPQSDYEGGVASGFDSSGKPFKI